MNKKEKSEKKPKKEKQSISSFTILALILLAVAVVTIIVGIFAPSEVTGATFPSIIMSPITGFSDALPVCLFVLVLGGFLGVMTETGALIAGISSLVKSLKGNELILIPILMFIFSIGGSTFGMCEEAVPFCLLLAATMVAAGFDSVVGASTVLLGCGSGVLGSTVNPFAVGASIDALSSKGLEVNQSLVIGLGAVMWIVTLVMCILFVMRYAKKVKADKGSTILSFQERQVMEVSFGKSETSNKTVGYEAVTSIVGNATKKNSATPAESTQGEDISAAEAALTGRQKASLIAMGIAFLIMITGFIPWEDFGIDVFTTGALSWSSWITGTPLGEWYFGEATAWFLLVTIATAFIAGMKESDFIKSFLVGASDMIGVMLVIALARSISVLMGDTGLDQFILGHAAEFLQGVSAMIFAPASYIFNVLLSFLVPSTSGMATMSMPIMGPLALELGFPVEIMITIFCAGSGLVNLFTPTNGALVGGLAIAKIEWATWLKWGAVLFIAIAVVSIIILTLAMVIL